MRRLAPFALFSVVACIVTWPLVLTPASRLGATSEFGDPYFALWVLGWDLTTISNRPEWLLNGRMFDAPFFYPATGTLAYSDHQIPQALSLWPIYAVSGNLIVCYNALLLLSMIFSAWAMYGFVRSLTRSEVAAYAAGMVWGFCPYRLTHLPHIQLQALYWMPVTFWLMHRLIAGRRRREAVLLGFVFALQALSSVYYAVIGVIGLGVAACVVAVRSGGWPARLLWRFALAAVVAAALALPGLLPYWRVQQREGFGRNVFEAGHNSATPRSYVTAPPANLLYGRSGLLRPAPDDQGRHPRDEPEKDLFPGFTVVVFAAVGIAAARALHLRLLVASMVAVGVAGVILSLGPLGIRPLYVALHSYVFGFHAIRAPARFSVLVFFALAVLAGLGLERLMRRADGTRRPSWLAALAMALMVVEFSTSGIAYAEAPPMRTAVGQWLREAPESGPVLYLPIGRDRDDALAMVAALEHGRPILNGYSGQRPALYAAVVDAIAAFPDKNSLLTLRELGVRFVVADGRLPTSGEGEISPLVERAALDGEVIYELRWTPEVAAAFEETNLVQLAAPGPLSFMATEVSQYDVRWVGGPMTVPAGEATISAERNAEGGLSIRVRARTAGWVRSFFEADDELTAETDGALLPKVYRESLNEGRRRARRSVSFDPAGQRVSVVNGDLPPVTLPLAREARDPLSAFYYVRSLPFDDRFKLTMPINDAGRSTTVGVVVTGAESVTIGGKAYDAWRVEPRLVERLAWREPPRITVWVSRDERKVPLLIKVSSAFGAVDLELKDYQAR